MNIERLNQIEKIYHAVLDVQGGARQSFFRKHCGADVDLQREIESLLAFEHFTDSFLDDAPDALAAEMFAEADESNDLTGKIIGRYEITEMLGRGGMGEVYLAEDTKLKRRVALKFLPAELTGNANRLKRFEREAQTASALNHPNILTIYEFGAENELHFLASEYVEGETLRQIISGGDLSLADALDIAEQIAFALSATHQANIIHRDIKPENVMIRRDGIVKVLDFGLAKLSEPTSSPEAQTRAFFQTNPGTVMGTVTYMSPEQTRGSETDARTDLWSLGVVLYEMLTGKPPFAGQTTNDAIAAILTGELPPLAQYVADIPAELQRIVRKSLEKKRDDRYQTARDLMTDIKTLRRELDLQSQIKRSNPPPPHEVNLLTTERNAAPHDTGEDYGQPTQINRVHKNDNSSLDSESDYLGEDFKILPRDTGDDYQAVTTLTAPDRKRKSKVNVLLFSALSTLVLIGGFFYADKQSFKTAPNSDASVVSFDKIELDRLTADGLIAATAISPDGKYVVFARKEGDRQSLWLRQTDAPGEVNIAPANGFDYQFLTFSKTEDALYFVAAENDEPSAIYRTNRLGQNQQKLISGVDSQISFSPDGKKLAFVRSPDDKTDVLLTFDLTTSEEKTLAVRKYPETFTEGVSWSPDGKRIAVAALVYGVSSTGGITVFDIETGENKPLTLSEKIIRASFLQWHPDGSGLFFCEHTAATGERFQIRYAAFPGGAIRNVTNDLSSYETISVSADGKRIAAVQRDYSMSIWVVPTNRAEPAAQIKPYAGRDDGERGVAWTSDGKIVYVSSDGGTENLWRMDADGGNQRNLTTGKDYGKSVPSLSVDGRSLIYLTSENDELNFWRTGFDGQHPARLTSDNIATIYPASANEKLIVYTGDKNGELRIWKKSFESEKAVQLTEIESWNPVISPDGKQIAFFQREEGSAVSLGFISIDTGKSVRSLELPGAVDHSRGLAWSRDGKSLLFVVSTGAVSNVWRQNLSGGAAKSLTNFKEFQIAAFALSFDSKSLAVARGANDRNVVLIKNTGN